MSRSLCLVVLFFFGLAAGGQAPQEEASVAQETPTTQQMQARMQAMHQQMERIHGTEDAAERQRLMREHMASMHEGMQMMGRMMGGPMGQHGSMPECQEGDAQCRMERMESRQRMMTEHMSMMHTMMGQMMQQMDQHQSTSEGAQETDH